MINFIDENGKQHSAIVECKKTKGVNGEKSLTGTIYTNDEILEGIGRGWRLQFEDENYCLTYANPIDEGTRIVVEFDAVHEFFFDLSKSVVYGELNGSNTATAYLDFIFNGSGYDYRLEVTIPAFEKENFGMKNRLVLFNDFITSTGVEFSVNGKIVRILEKVGSNLSTIVKKGFNLNELKIEKDAGSFITYIKGFGAYNDPDDHSKGRLEVEYLSPLADIYGKLEGDPVVDERYTKSESLLNRLKNEVESSYGVSVDIDMEDLTKAGYEYDQPHEGDYIMAINKDLGFEQKIRIMSYTTSYDTEGNVIDHEVSCGSDNIIKQAAKSERDFQKNVQVGLENAIDTANQAWISAGGKNTVFTGTDEPTATNKGDIWYQVDGEKTIMKFWNGYEWQAFIDPKAVQQAADEAKALGEEAKQAGEEAKAIGNEALEAGKNAVDKATTADSNASTALTNANSAVDQATQASQKADNSATTANEAKRQASTAESNANTALANANKAVKDVGDLSGVVTTNTASIEDLEDKVAIKADKSTVDAVTGRVSTAEGNITTMAGQIELKASKTSVDTLTNRVSSAESTLTTQAGSITALNSLTDGHTTQIGNLKSSYDGMSSTIATVQNTVNTLDKSITWQTLTTGQDLNKFVTTGNYFVASVNNVNAPMADRWFYLQVDVVNGRIKQLYQDDYDIKNNYFRMSNDSGKTWKEWQRVVNDVEFSSLSQTVNSIQLTVANKAEQSQVTQLAGQITAIVVSGGAGNLLNNSTFSKYGDSWSFNTKGLNVAYDRSLANKGKIGIHFYGQPTEIYQGIYQYIKQSVKKNQKVYLTGLFSMDGGADNQNHSIGIHFRNSSYSIVGQKWVKIPFTKLSSDYSQFTLEFVNDWDDITNIVLMIYADIPNVDYNAYISELSLSLEKPVYVWQEGLGYQASQITQLADRMNFRITNSDGSITQIDLANKVISLSGEQVNITGNTYIANGVIKTAAIADLAVSAAKIANLTVSEGKIADLAVTNAKIANLAVSTAKIADLAVTNAKIGSISADKINVGTLNAANVNIINLNASNITSGTISGSNLSINLSTGVVNFKKGRINSASNNIDINIDAGYFSVADSSTRVIIKGGELQFVSPTIFDLDTNPYLSIDNSGGSQGLYGASIVGRDFISLANRANNTNMFDIPIGLEAFAGISFGKPSGSWRPTKIGGAERGIILSGGAALSDSLDSFKGSPRIVIGSGVDGQAGGNRIYILGEYIHTRSVYTKTTSTAANVVVATDGALVRSTSASKYKSDIQRFYDTSIGEKLLDLPYATWLDKAEMQRYSENPTLPIPRKNFGMIAEDLADAGLEELVVRGENNQLEGIQYERLAVALIPVIRELKQEIETLKARVA